MNVRTKFLIAVLGSAALLAARPGATFTLVERNGVDAHMTLSQAAFCDGSARTRLEPGAYDLRVSTFADGSVRAVFFQGGVRKGETRAIHAPGSNQILIGLLVPAVQKAREAAAPPAHKAPDTVPGSSKIKN